MWKPVPTLMRLRREIRDLHGQKQALAEDLEAHRRAALLLDRLPEQAPENGDGRLIQGLQQGLAEAKQRDLDAQIKLAELRAGLDMMKLIFTLAILLLTVVGTLGITNTVQVHGVVGEAKRATQEVNDVKTAGARTAQELTVYALENLLEGQESFDSIHKNPTVLAQLQALTQDLARIRARLDPAEATTYHRVVEALARYNARNYVDALRLLEQVRDEDRNHFAYAYLKALCLLRSGEPAAKAEPHFRLAVTWGQGRRNLERLSQNGRGICQLYGWKQTGNPAKRYQAVHTFDQLVRTNPTDPVAYFNHALSLAQDPAQYAAASRELLAITRSGAWSLDALIDYIRDDLLEEHEDFLRAYVQDHLLVKEDPGDDPRWKEGMKQALAREFKQPFSDRPTTQTTSKKG